MLDSPRSGRLLATAAGEKTLSNIHDDGDNEFVPQVGAVM